MAQLLHTEFASLLRRSDLTQAEFARLGALHHPDKGGDHALMQRINAAYAEGTGRHERSPTRRRPGRG